MPYIAAIDQGTTSSRTIIFNHQSELMAIAQQEFAQSYPRNGWVEHDPEEIWSTTLATLRSAISEAGLSAVDISAIGITNQRETTMIWDRDTGEPVYPAIVWQDRRTAEMCEALKAAGLEQMIRDRTGLLLDPYFSATKIKWLLDEVDGVRARALKGDLAFGTVDSFLIWRLSGGRVHKTDATNASRTALFNIHEQRWDNDILAALDIPETLLPAVEDCAGDYGTTAPSLLETAIPIAGVAGDQQAALIGQCCFEPGMVKSTYGTGCFVMLNTGDHALQSDHRLLTTVAYRLDGKVTYGLEGSIFVAGAAVKWLRDRLHLIATAADTEAITARNPDAGGVFVVPSFTGLGAPYWDTHARGAIVGLTLDSSADDIVTATLESICYQTRDLTTAMVEDGASLGTLRVDGGMVVNDWLCQRLANTLQLAVERPRYAETTALGAAYLAGLQVGVFDDLGALSADWHLDRAFSPETDPARSAAAYQNWLEAVARVRSSR